MPTNRMLRLGAALAVAHCVAGDGIIEQAPNNNDDNDGIISIPLLGHHHVIERRRRELRAAGLDLDDDDEEDFDRNLLRHGRRLDSNEQHPQQQLGALYQGYGTHYIDIWVGHPAQRQTAVVDTGSSVTAFPCSGCAKDAEGGGCGQHADPPFDESRSESFRTLSCRASDSRRCAFGRCDDEEDRCVVEHQFGARGSPDASGWTAFEAQDVAYAGGPHDRPVDGAMAASAGGAEDDGIDPVLAPEFSFPLTFGCQTSVSGYFEKQLASGVMGLDRRAQSFWGQMRASQTIRRAKFSLCFVKQPIASMSGSTAGAVTLGGVDRRLHKTPMVFARALGEGATASFRVRLRKMYLREGNDQSVMFDARHKYHELALHEDELNGSEMYSFDSGTTDTYFIKSLSAEFRRLWTDVTKMEYTNDPIAVRRDSDLLRFPTVVLQLVPHNGGVGDEVKTGDPRTVPGLAGNVDMGTPNDVLLAIPPKHYMQRNAKDGTYASRIYLDRDDALGNVLGANAMMGHDILFDMDDARIGFSESECDYARLVAEGGGSASAQAKSGEGGGGGMPATASEEGSDYKLCESMKCRGMFGLTVSLFSLCCFLFARRYVTKRDGESCSLGAAAASVTESGYEMNSSSRNLHATRGDREGGSYSDSDYATENSSRYSDERDLPGGERGGYRDNVPPPPDRRSGGRRSGSRESARSRHSERSHRSSEQQRRSSRDRDGEGYGSSDSAGENTHRSGRSGRTHRSQGSGGSGGSGGSRETKRSARSSRSHGTHRTGGSRESHRTSGTRESHRSSRSKESHRSSGTRESHRSGGSGRRHHDDGRDRHSDGDGGGRRSGGSSRRIRDEYDDIPTPPSIA